MRRYLMVATILAVLLLAVDVGASALPMAKITVNVSELGKEIPAGFAGFSIEVHSTVNRYLGPASDPNLVFYQLLENLGKGTLRIGGNSTDESCWDPARAPVPQGCQFVIRPDGLAGFMKASAATGWGLIVGVNLAQDSASWAEEYGQAVVRAARAVHGSNVVAFEFGNEPDAFPNHKLYDHHFARPASFSVSELAKEWKSYASAFRSNPLTAPVPIAGPAICCKFIRIRSSLGEFLSDVGHKDLNLVTVHNYPLTHCGGKRPTIAQLLAPTLMQSAAEEARRLAVVAHHAGFPIQLGETNSISCQGLNGVSNVFAETAWALDYMFINFQAGMKALNFHDGGYTPGRGDYYYDADQIDAEKMADGKVIYHNHVWPLYYAMYAFSRKAEGGRLLPVTASSQANVAAYAVRSSARGPVTVFVINKDLRASGDVSVRLSAKMGSARLLVIRAPSLTSRAVTYGGVRFSNQTGKLAGKPRTRTIDPGARGRYEFHLPVAAIGILTIG